MAKQLFQSRAASIKKKVSFQVSSDLYLRLETIERRAELVGVSFSLNEHVEDSIHRLVKAAESQLDEIESDALKQAALGASSDSGFDLSATRHTPTA